MAMAAGAYARTHPNESILSPRSMWFGGED